MKTIYFLLLGLVISFQGFGNETDSIVDFSSAIKKNFREYVSKSNKAYNDKNYTEAESLFNDLVTQKLLGTKFDNFTFKRVGKKDLKINDIELPTIIYTYASWCLIEKGEFPAINKLAAEYKGKVKIVVVFWDTKENMKKLSKGLSSDIEVCYAHETYPEDVKVVNLLKNTLGFPTTYFLSANQNILAIKKNVMKADYNVDFNESLANNMNEINDQITEVLISNSINNSGYVVK